MPQQRKLLISLAVLAALALVLFLSMGGSDAPTLAEGSSEESATAEDATQINATRPAISVAEATKAVLRDTVRASGLVSAVQQVLVQPQVEGQAIDMLMAEVGDHVTEGQVLARLSDSALKLQKTQLIASRANALAGIAQADAQMVEAAAAAEEAKRNWDRSEQLRKQGNTSQAAADQAGTALTSANARVLVATQGAAAAKAQLELVDAQIANVELQLARTDIKAPFAGEVVQKNAVVGGIASALGQPMFVIVRDAILELEADVAEQDLARLSVGMGAVLRAAGQKDTLTGTVRLVEPAINVTTRQGRARITIAEADRIRTGMFLEAAIEVSEREVVAVPITALATDDQGAFVMTVDTEGRVHRTPVESGVRDGRLVEIRTGLEPGVLVVAKAASFVRDGDFVQPVAASEPAVTN